MQAREDGAAAGGLTLSTREFEYDLGEDFDTADITGDVAAAVTASGIRTGMATVFVPGATGAVTCLEYEPGVVADFRQAIERLAPRDDHYDHNVRMDDGNGHSHVRAGLLGPSLAVPVVDGRLTLGTWQQIVLVNFDNRPRRRRVAVQVAGV